MTSHNHVPLPRKKLYLWFLSEAYTHINDDTASINILDYYQCLEEILLAAAVHWELIDMTHLLYMNSEKSLRSDLIHFMLIINYARKCYYGWTCFQLLDSMCEPFVLPTPWKPQIWLTGWHLRKGINLASIRIFGMRHVLKQIVLGRGSKMAHLSLFVI